MYLSPAPQNNMSHHLQFVLSYSMAQEWYSMFEQTFPFVFAQQVTPCIDMSTANFLPQMQFEFFGQGIRKVHRVHLCW